ncbi:hypothetical protein GQ53DRAFT_755594 [Thozetella sp. PMI_491]|nr:hypothetical protein GQ53DRAFT_755594 [Thozetella sp. PMI_491]
MTATTALTAQNTRGVYDVHHVPAAFLRKQIDACLDDIGADVVKTGMLASAETIETVATALREHRVQKLVVDPVMVATTGAQLLPPAALHALRTKILPQTTILTPNVPEARLILGDAGYGHLAIESVGDLETIAHTIQGLGPEWVLVKGGHCPFRTDGAAALSEREKQLVVDVLVSRDQTIRFESPYLESRNTHGTGCSLASAIASGVARGDDIPKAVRAACRYVEAGIKTAPGLGQGNGPLNHFHSTYTLPFAPGRFIEYLLERSDVAGVWDRFVNHPFVLAMGNGTLPRESFKGYLVQDYLYLIHFARANSLASYKAKNMGDIVAGAHIVAHIARETNLHVDYCKGFGISKEQMEVAEEKEACTAYTRYVLDIGQSEDWIGLQVALAPCLLGYGVVAKQLHADPRSVKEGNHYWSWIENYVAEDYVTAVKTGSELLEKHAVLQSPARIEELVKVFIHATKMEIAFWEMYPSA